MLRSPPSTVAGVTPSAADSSSRNGGPSILVVDDDADIAHLLGMLLTSYGYVVVQACSVAEAVERYRDHGPIHLVISDIGLADGTGTQLVERLGHPLARALFTSGHQRATFAGTPAAIPPDAVFLQKPIAATTLLSTVRGMLAEAE